jgi:hypothetical protein
LVAVPALQVLLVPMIFEALENAGVPACAAPGLPFGAANG